MQSNKESTINQVLDGFQIISKTEDTKIAYLKRVEQLRKRAAKELEINLNELAKNGKLDPVIGRKKEVRAMIKTMYPCEMIDDLEADDIISMYQFRRI